MTFLGRRVRGGCVLDLASLVSISIDIGSSSVGLKICAITATVKKFKSMIKEIRKKLDKIVLFGKTKIIAYGF